MFKDLKGIENWYYTHNSIVERFLVVSMLFNWTLDILLTVQLKSMQPVFLIHKNLMTRKISEIVCMEKRAN